MHLDRQARRGRTEGRGVPSPRVAEQDVASGGSTGFGWLSYDPPEETGAAASDEAVCLLPPRNEHILESLCTERRRDAARAVNAAAYSGVSPDEKSRPAKRTGCGAVTRYRPIGIRG
jgi:hypothetical protein